MADSLYKYRSLRFFYRGSAFLPKIFLWRLNYRSDLKKLGRNKTGTDVLYRIGEYDGVPAAQGVSGGRGEKVRGFCLSDTLSNGKVCDKPNGVVIKPLKFQ